MGSPEQRTHSTDGQGQQPLSTRPCVVLLRYTDTIYIMFANMKGELLAQVCYAVSALLHSLYGLQLKWEKHDEFVTWGVAELTLSTTAVSMCRKGVVRSLQDDLIGREWEVGAQGQLECQVHFEVSSAHPVYLFSMVCSMQI